MTIQFISRVMKKGVLENKDYIYRHVVENEKHCVYRLAKHLLKENPRYVDINRYKNKWIKIY